MYIVQPGDTIGGIAGMNGTSIEALLALNPDITNRNIILVGQQIELTGSWPQEVVVSGGAKNAWEFFSPATIADATDSTPARIDANWPHIHWALVELGIGGRLTQAAAIATVRLEVGSRFAPINEFFSAHWNTYSGGPNYHGRGYIQLTHDYNYKTYGDLIGVNLVGNPDLALDVSISAWVLAHYFKKRGTSAAAERRDWNQVRVSVLGRPQPGAIEAIVARLGV